MSAVGLESDLSVEEKGENEKTVLDVNHPHHEKRAIGTEKAFSKGTVLDEYPFEVAFDWDYAFDPDSGAAATAIGDDV